MKKISMICMIILASMGVFYSINEATNSSQGDEDFKNPIATVTLENNKIFKIELYPKYAPNTVNNFIDLAHKNFYDGMPFSKIVPQYLLQSGDPIGDGTGFPGYFIKSECKQNGYKNKLKAEEGVIFMARGRRYNTEGSQFFILLRNDSSLNGQYTAFGKVIEGMDMLRNIGETEVNDKYIPNKEIKIKTIEVNTFGIQYAEPKVLSIYEQRKKSIK